MQCDPLPLTLRAAGLRGSQIVPRKGGDEGTGSSVGQCPDRTLSSSLPLTASCPRTLCTMRAAILALAAVAAQLPFGLSHGADLLSAGCRPLPRQSHLERRQTAPPSAPSEGAISTSSGGAAAAEYNCDPNTCRMPNCRCADTRPPGNLALK